MYELIQAGENTYYIDCPSKIGLCRTEAGVYLIDSGSDKDAGKKALKILEQNGWPLLGVLATHAHADHIGGCRYLQAQTGCKVFAHEIESAFAAYPILEPAFLYGGYPPRDLRRKFLMAQDSRISPFSDPDFPGEIQPIPLPGHCFSQVGFRTPDSVVFLADCVASPATLEKYALTFLWDVAAYRKTLDQVEAMEAVLFIPAHADACADAGDLVRINREKVDQAAELLMELCREPSSFEKILQQVFRRCGLSMSFAQYALVGSTVRSYLAFLRDAGRLEPVFQEETLLWRAVQ